MPNRSTSAHTPTALLRSALRRDGGQIDLQPRSSLPYESPPTRSNLWPPWTAVSPPAGRRVPVGRARTREWRKRGREENDDAVHRRHCGRTVDPAARPDPGPHHPGRSPAGVSPTTVSHVLSGKRLVAEETRGTVREAIRMLGYRPNHVARSLRTRRSHMIAVVVPDVTNTFYSVLTRGLADTLSAEGYGSYVCNTDGLLDREVTFLDDALDRGADGIVLAAVDAASAGALKPADMGVPV